MRVDALTLRAVASELETLITGARIDPVIAPTPHAVAMQCYRDGQNRWLLLSAHPQLARVHLLHQKPTKLVAEPSTFVMLLRKYLEMGRVDRINCVTWERVIEIGVRQYDGTHLDIIVEVMGNLSNVILVDEDRMILGALHPVSANINRYRTILPGRPYLGPPPQTRTVAGEMVPRPTLDTITADDLMMGVRELVAVEQSGSVAASRVVLMNLAGASQDITTEAFCRAGYAPKTTISPDDVVAWQAIVTALHAIGERAGRNAWEPVTILDADGIITDAALWPPCVGADRPQKRAASVNELLAAYFTTREWTDALGSARAELRRNLKTVHDRLDKKDKTLTAELAELQKATRLREEGELLLAYASEISAEAKAFTPPDLGDGLVQAPIALDPTLTAIENANQRFARYHKMRRAAAQIPEQLALAEIELALVEQLQTDLELADSLAEIAHVREEIATANIGRVGQEDRKPKLKIKVKGKPGKGAKGSKEKSSKQMVGGTPLVLKSADGFPLYVGKNSNQNEQVTFGIATGSDLWFHARGVPGSHVIIKNAGRPVPDETIHEAARLAAWYSQSRGAKSIPVDYTEQRYVRHMKNGGPGMVTYSKERTIHAVPRDGGEAR